MNHVDSPRTDDGAIEKEILHKGLTAPRVTPQDIENVIIGEYYFTGADAMNNRLLPNTQQKQSLSLLTFCVLVTNNGYTVTGESACASPENFDPSIGRKIAFENAKQKLWPLLGYQLKQRLFEQQGEKHVQP